MLSKPGSRPKYTTTLLLSETLHIVYLSRIPREKPRKKLFGQKGLFNIQGFRPLCDQSDELSQ